MTSFEKLPLPPGFSYREGQLYLEELKLSEIAREVGTPCFVYGANVLRQNYQRYTTAFAEAGLDLSVCYALKACSNLAVVRLFGEEGAGADVVSGGELFRALKAGIASDKIVFAGVGKTSAEIEMGLNAGIRAFNVESEPELELIEQRAKALERIARVSMRVNPDVEAHTHHYITTGKKANKFGMPVAQVTRLAGRVAKSPYLRLVGLQSHIGSQLLEVEPLAEALRVVAGLALKIERDENIALDYLDIGGGLGVAYNLREEQTASPEKLAALVKEVLADYPKSWPLLCEPGRWLVANAGVLLTEVLYLKEDGSDDENSPHFAIVDAAMNDLIRPSLYQAYHEIVPLQLEPDRELTNYEIVGPVCESGDFLAHARPLPGLQAGEKLAILGAGAYSFSMSSNYNSRGRAAEVLVDGTNWKIIRSRETYEDLVRGEAE